MRLRIVVACLFVSGLAAADDAVPAPEVRAYDTQLILPPVPSFELPPPEPGFVDPRYLRVRGKQLLDTQVKVKGYIIWIYDCIDATRKPKQSRKQVQKLIEDDPTLCERPKFYLGSTRDTPPERGLWVVDVPRAPNKLEKLRLPKQELAAWPKVPKLKLGDYVVVSGEFKISSPHSERNSDGLIVFSAIEGAKPTKLPAAPPVTGAVPATAPARAIPKAPPQKHVDAKVMSATTEAQNKGTRFAGAKQFKDAIDAYRRAINVHAGNHNAWYGLGGVYGQQGDWKAALDAFEHAVKLRPDQSMYQMWSGIASFEAAAGQARIDQAKQQNAKPEDITPDLSSVRFDAARDRLELAIAIEPKLWRAHYYLGKIYRTADQPKAAAESFTQAIISNRTQPAPFIALGELYRRWDYSDQAIAVAQLGTKELPATSDASDVFYVLAMAYDDKRDYKKAVEGFTRALELRPDNYKAMFQRGQAYFRMKKRNDAKRDLEAFVAAPSQLEFAKQQAHKMLSDIAGTK